MLSAQLWSPFILTWKEISFQGSTPPKQKTRQRSSKGLIKFIKDIMVIREGLNKQESNFSCPGSSLIRFVGKGLSTVVAGGLEGTAGTGFLSHDW